MKIVFDSSVIVDIDHGKQETVETMKEIVEEEHSMLISTVTVSEILAGAHRKNKVKDARKVLGQFQWIEMEGEVADITGRIISRLYDRGKPVQFQDVVIAASAEKENADFLVTGDREHFSYMNLEAEVTGIEEIREKI